MEDLSERILTECSSVEQALKLMVSLKAARNGIGYTQYITDCGFNLKTWSRHMSGKKISQGVFTKYVRVLAETATEKEALHYHWENYQAGEPQSSGITKISAKVLVAAERRLLNQLGSEADLARAIKDREYFAELIRSLVHQPRINEDTDDAIRNALGLLRFTLQNQTALDIDDFEKRVLLIMNNVLYAASRIGMTPLQRSAIDFVANSGFQNKAYVETLENTYNYRLLQHRTDPVAMRQRRLYIERTKEAGHMQVRDESEHPYFASSVNPKLHTVGDFINLCYAAGPAMVDLVPGLLKEFRLAVDEIGFPSVEQEIILRNILVKSHLAMGNLEAAEDELKSIMWFAEPYRMIYPMAWAGFRRWQAEFEYWVAKRDGSGAHNRALAVIDDAIAQLMATGQDRLAQDCKALKMDIVRGNLKS